MRKSTLHTFVQKIVSVKDSEVTSLLSGFGAFCCALGAYFLLLPLRDEAGLTLGTDVIPTLFNTSFGLTVIATPVASAFLARPGVKRSKAVQQLFTLFALSVLVFFFLYQAVSSQLQQPSSPTLLHEHRQLQQHSSHSNSNSSVTQGNTASQVKAGDPSLTGAQKAVRVAFYLWLSLLNLLATSTLWARAADAFDSSAASRLFGFLGAGATLGQLAGSIIAAAWATLPSFTLAGNRPRSDGPPLAPLLLSAVLLEAAGRMAANMHSSSSETLEHLSSNSKKAESEIEAVLEHARRAQSVAMLSHANQQGKHPKSHSGKPVWASWDLSAVKRGLSQLLEGFRLIAKSGYLCHVCLHFVLHYIVSTFFYFERTLVVAGGGGSASQRVATFATINSMSAGAVVLIQLTATGQMLSRLGVAWSLTAAPLVSVVLMAATAAFPNTITIGISEVLRKVINYSLTRPAREILYTVLSTEEKYKAKVCIDTIILRMGDSIGAAVFRLFDSLLGFGPAGLAAAAVPLCIVWSAVALQLGRKQQKLSGPRGFDH